MYIRSTSGHMEFRPSEHLMTAATKSSSLRPTSFDRSSHDGALVPSKITDTKEQLLDAMQEGLEVLHNITDVFIPLMKDFHLFFFFWGQVKTNMGVTQNYVRRNSYWEGER